MKVAIGNDHRGVKQKNKIIKYLQKQRVQVLNVGTNNEKEPVDYPYYGYRVGELVVDGTADMGIVICGTGIGISIACNKVKGARCAKVDNVEEALLVREHNDANVLAIGEKMPFYRVKDILDVFLTTNYVPVERHERRIEVIKQLEEHGLKMEESDV